MNFGLEGKVIAVTGAGSGIGRATAILMAAQGAKVAMVDINEAGMAETLDTIKAAGGEATVFVTDVRKEESVQAAADAVAAAYGPVYGLAACAGVSGAMTAEELTLAEIERIYSVNTQGVFLCCQAFGKQMIAQKKGAIVAISSMAGFGGQSGRMSYTMSKYAVNGIIKSLAVEWGRYGVRVNGVAPTYVDTPMIWAAIPTDFLEDMYDRNPMGRGAQAEEIANPIAFFLSEAASMVNGVVMPVDGGMMSGFHTRRNGRDLASKRMLAAGLYSDE